MRAFLVLSFFCFAGLVAQSSDIPLSTDKVYIGKPEGVRNETPEEDIIKARQLKAEKRRSLELTARLSEARSGARSVQLADKSYCANSRAQFAIAAEDDLSGLARFHYKIDDAEWMSYTGPVSISAEGVHYLKWESFDKVGNREDQQTLKVRIDDTAPALTVTPHGRFVVRKNGFIAAPGFRFVVSAHDHDCGLQSMYANINNEGWHALKGGIDFEKPGLHQAQFMADDILGNRSNVTAHTVEIDGTAPVTRIEVTPRPIQAESDLVCKPNTVVTISAADRESAVERIEYRYSPNAAWAGSMDTTMPVARSENFYIEARSRDIVGNTESKPAIFKC
ncbi:MAG TPA: hypothetical protein PKM44_13650, partial [Turneriella sp.]|nr:hypothetical protein [Turneriella sp.]